MDSNTDRNMRTLCEMFMVKNERILLRLSDDSIDFSESDLVAIVESVMNDFTIGGIYYTKDEIAILQRILIIIAVKRNL